MKKEAQILMLSTENEVDIGDIYKCIKERNFDSLNRIGDLIPNKNSNLTRSNEAFQAQHLYFTTDKVIKEGDWFIFNDSILKSDDNSLRDRQDLVKKIIATTDKSLTIRKYKSKDKLQFDIINLPQPSQAFIEKYCKIGGIKEVYLEYEVYDVSELSPTWEENYLKFGIKHKPNIVNRLKIENNCVITSPIEPKLYTKEEVEHLLFKYAEEEHAWFSCKSEITSFNNWVKENVK